MDSEARLSDHKRVATKSALSLKFGGLLELAEKATIVGELGKLLIEEVPLETTPPGYGRGPYQGACLLRWRALLATHGLTRLLPPDCRSRQDRAPR